MKKISIIILAMVITILCGCVGTTQTSNNSPATYSSTSTKTTTNEVSTPSIPTYSWDQAINHIGEYAIVEGPVVSVRYSQTDYGEMAFLNIGKDYPDEDRFYAVIYGNYRDNFVDDLEANYYAAYVTITGTIQEYNGIAQIIMKSANQITVK